MTTVLVTFEERRARFEELYGKGEDLTDAEHKEMNDLYFGFSPVEVCMLEGVKTCKQAAEQFRAYAKANEGRATPFGGGASRIAAMLGQAQILDYFGDQPVPPKMMKDYDRLFVDPKQGYVR